MQTSLDCIPCFVRQALEATRFVTADPAVHERVLRGVLSDAATMDLACSPVLVAQKIHRSLRQLTGVADPYQTEKQRFNRMALAMLPELACRVARTGDPLQMAVRVAIAGNVIDLGVSGRLGEHDARAAIESAMDEPFHGDVNAFGRAVTEARSILYLADNAGEIVFDRLLVEQLSGKEVTVAVRGSPVLNDAVMEDAEEVSFPDCVEIIDNGSDAPGTVLPDCSEEFRRRFAEADLVIAKGQGNFESLSDEPGNICFLLKAKCHVIADHLGLPVGTHVLIRGQPLSASITGGRHAGR